MASRVGDRCKLPCFASFYPYIDKMFPMMAHEKMNRFEAGVMVIVCVYVCLIYGL